ncbi:malectin domain-containing carbohydrate-binding protein [Edaphobacter modestus]|uniref:malectin domain-containing carbohydrate-binding protein n=1 Tax=Edaphobacter modestus TaxID=388466 RepID=UPI0024151216|nr:malectin domain-containing carbohydrate-binding protein [Edaphobacter modestus]
MLSSQTPGGQTPPAAPANLTATVGTSSIVLSWSPSTNAVSYALFRGSAAGNETELVENLTGTQFTDNNVIPATTYFYKVEAVNGAGASSFSNETQAAMPGNSQPSGNSVVQIDSGSTTTVGSFVADEYADGGSVTPNVGVPIDTTKAQNPAPMEVYQTNRYGNFTYTIPNLSSGTPYILRLHFAETYWGQSGSRLFNILVNGQTVQSNLDIFAASGGKDAAISIDYPVTAQNGQLAISFQTVRDNALVSGVELLNTATPAPMTSVYQVDAGSSVPVSTFSADSFVSGGTTSQTNGTITTTGVKNAAPAAVYQTNRFGNSTYTFPGLKTGSQYTIRSHFAETYWGAAGSRLFNILINGQVAQPNYDIFAAAGGKDIATTLDLPATAQNGQITVQYQTVKDNALVSGIEVIGDGSMMSAPNPPASLHAAAGVGQVSLTWAPSSTGTYSVFRGNVAGAEEAPPIAIGLTGTSFIDKNLPNGGAVFYTVKTVSSTGTSAASNEASAIPGAAVTGAPVYQIAAGSSSAAAPFQADAFFAGGNASGGAVRQTCLQRSARLRQRSTSKSGPAAPSPIRFRTLRLGPATRCASTSTSSTGNWLVSASST